jgi:RNA polymerase sigma factor (sigma-70 family)
VELQPFDGPSVSDASALVADRDLLDRALRSLEPAARAPIVMHYFLGMSVPEVADALGIPLGTAKSRISRSLAQMRVVAEGERAPTLPLEAAISPARQGRSA